MLEAAEGYRTIHRVHANGAELSSLEEKNRTPLKG